VVFPTPKNDAKFYAAATDQFSGQILPQHVAAQVQPFVG
jgi:hypothetical protein